jgi:hypothetical protein
MQFQQQVLAWRNAIELRDIDGLRQVYATGLVTEVASNGVLIEGLPRVLSRYQQMVERYLIRIDVLDAGFTERGEFSLAYLKLRWYRIPRAFEPQLQDGSDDEPGTELTLDFAASMLAINEEGVPRIFHVHFSRID